MSQTKETAFHDFKWTLDIAKGSQDFPKIIKDVYAFSKNFFLKFLVHDLHIIFFVNNRSFLLNFENALILSGFLLC